jgi:hypothetical protein
MTQLRTIANASILRLVAPVGSSLYIAMDYSISLALIDSKK